MPSARPVLSALVVVAVMAAAGAVGTGQAPTAPQTQFQSGVDVVLVDVTVLDRGGSPIATLGPGDFTVTVDGRPRRLQSVRLVRGDGSVAASSAIAAPAGTPPAPSSTPAAPSPRSFVLVVDREHIPVGEGQPMLAAAAKFVDGLAPGDRLALWTTAQTVSSLAFTESRDALKARLRSSVGTYRPSFGPWNIGRDEAVRAEVQPGGSFTVVVDGREERFPVALKPVIERECDRQPPTCPGQVQAQAAEIARDAMQSADTALANIGSLLDSLAPIEGPKHVVLVTGGLVLTVDNMTRIGSLAPRAAAARATIHAIQVHDPGAAARTDLMRPSTDTVDQVQSAAYQLATITGGLALTPVTGEIGFTRLTRELAVAYELAFEAEPPDRDGKVHAIDVKVRDLGFGALVRARKNFRVDPNAPRRVAPIAPPTAAPTAAPAAAPDAAPSAASTPPAPKAKAPAAGPRDAAVDEIVRKMAAYVEAYGPQTSAIVGVEKYTQNVTIEEKNLRPRNLLAEFAIVRAGASGGWTGYRDVVEVDGREVSDRRDRLMSVVAAPGGREPELRRIADESTRFNVGPIIRNFNVPTTALFFMHPSLVDRFTFKRKGTKKIDGVAVWELDFKETQEPTLVVKRDGTNVPCEGTVWVAPEDGTVVRTRLKLRNFANAMTMTSSDRRGAGGAGGQGYVAPPSPQPQQPQPPPQQPAQPPAQGGGGQAPPAQGGGQAPPAQGGGQSGGGYGGAPQSGAAHGGGARSADSMEAMFGSMAEIESLVDIDVTYSREVASGFWLPSKMTEVYEGPITLGTRAPMQGRSVGSARYSDFKRFETSGRLVPPK